MTSERGLRNARGFLDPPRKVPRHSTNAHPHMQTTGPTAQLVPPDSVRVFLLRILSGRRPFFLVLLLLLLLLPQQLLGVLIASLSNTPELFLVCLLEAPRAQHLRQATLLFPTLHTHNHRAS